MERAIVVKGTLSDLTHIELDEPVTEIQGSVEVVVRRVVETLQTGIFQQANYQAWEAAFDAWVEGMTAPRRFLLLSLSVGKAFMRIGRDSVSGGYQQTTRADEERVRCRGR